MAKWVVSCLPVVKSGWELMSEHVRTNLLICLSQMITTFPSKVSHMVTSKVSHMVTSRVSHMVKKKFIIKSKSKLQ